MVAKVHHSSPNSKRYRQFQQTPIGKKVTK